MKNSFLRGIGLAFSFFPVWYAANYFQSEIAATWLQILLIENVFIQPYLAARNILYIKWRRPLLTRPHLKNFFALLLVYGATLTFLVPTHLIILLVGVGIIRYLLNAFIACYIVLQRVLFVEAIEKIAPSLLLSILFFALIDVNLTYIISSYFSVYICVLFFAAASGGLRIIKHSEQNHDDFERDGRAQVYLNYFQAFSAQGDQAILSLLLPSEAFVQVRFLSLVFRNMMALATAKSVYNLAELGNQTLQIKQYLYSENSKFILIYFLGTSFILFLYFTAPLGIQILKSEASIVLLFATTYAIPTSFFLYGTFLVYSGQEKRIIFIKAATSLAIALSILGLQSFGFLSPYSYIFILALVFLVSALYQRYISKQFIDYHHFTRSH